MASCKIVVLPRHKKWNKFAILEKVIRLCWQIQKLWQWHSMGSSSGCGHQVIEKSATIRLWTPGHWEISHQAVDTRVLRNQPPSGCGHQVIEKSAIRLWTPGGWFNKNMSSYQYRKTHCGDKTILRPSYLHNGISYTGKMTSLYWIRTQGIEKPATIRLWTPQSIQKSPTPSNKYGGWCCIS